MKTYLFSKSKLFCFSVIFCAAVVVLSLGCKPITSADISGVYVRASDGVSDKVVLGTDGSFQQTITFTNGHSWKKSGSWKFHGGSVEFDELYEAFEIETGAHAVVTIPPELLGPMFLEVQEGKLLRNTVEPIWRKQQSGSNATIRP